jgi:hypothetical protein
MKFAVCGDSWFCSDLSYPGKSFGEKLAQNTGWEFISLARGGCSNFAIALQVDYAIKQNVDYVILGPTTPDRIELAIQNNTNAGVWDTVKKYFSWDGWANHQPKMFDKSRGLENIQYSPHPDLSSQNPDLINPSIVSESMNNLCFDGSPNSSYYNLTNSQKLALKSYMVSLYDRGIKSQYDRWVISDACRRLQNANIQFLVYTGFLYADPAEAEDIAWLPRKNLIYPDEDFNIKDFGSGPARFHYDHNHNLIGYVAKIFEKRLRDL